MTPKKEDVRRRNGRSGLVDAVSSRRHGASYGPGKTETDFVESDQVL